MNPPFKGGHLIQSMSSINHHTPIERGLLSCASLSPRDRIDLLVEEYRAMYGLLSFRLDVVDQRVPFTAGAMLAALSSVPALPTTSQVVVLLLIPVGIDWLMRLTVSQARSKEDVLRRIDEIERQINLLAGEELLVFQSHHPNRRAVVSGGRTGAGTVASVLALCLAGLLGCLALAIHLRALHGMALWVYLGYLAVCMFQLLHDVTRFRRYRYLKSHPEPPPVVRVFGRRGTPLDDRDGHGDIL